jgi:multicomponent K+:H+ antiporter subunit A
MALMPVMGTLVLVAAAAMAGHAAVQRLHQQGDDAATRRCMPAAMWGIGGWLVPVLATLGGLFSAAYSLRLVHDVFFNGPPRDLPAAPARAAAGHEGAGDAAGGVCIAVGLMPMLIAGPLVRVAAPRRSARRRRPSTWRCGTA